MNKNLLKKGNKIFTKNLDPGQKVYGERLEKGWREWDPNRSKLGAAIVKGMKNFPFKEDSNVLYLGAAQGTTPSHVSDLVSDGFVVCIEISQTAFNKLMPLCDRRENMIPILADAGKPEDYSEYLEEIDIVFQDVAQPNQADIFLRNMRATKAKHGLLAIKSRSVDVTKNPEEVFKKEIAKLKKELKVLEVIHLDPFEKDHVMVVCEN